MIGSSSGASYDRQALELVMICSSSGASYDRLKFWS